PDALDVAFGAALLAAPGSAIIVQDDPSTSDGPNVVRSHRPHGINILTRRCRLPGPGGPVILQDGPAGARGPDVVPIEALDGPEPVTDVLDFVVPRSAIVLEDVAIAPD